MRDVRGTSVVISGDEVESFRQKGAKIIPSFDEVRSDKLKYAKAFREQERNTDALNADVLIQKQANGKYVLQNKPAYPLTVEEMDEVYSLPYERTWHPIY
jgi:hypothetical protein